MGLRDVLRGKRKTAVAEASGEPWRPAGKPGEDTVEIASVVADGPGPGEADGDEGGAPARPGRPAGRG
ncbi:hypothetical protein [Actinospica robiniae]|uniref:hypothetical protein n=1 Tax=Actinospica robiniae TaxID=304901 RepID=UPI0003FF38AF|nr:hypothetical protein [Actinospica robiniae]